MFSNYLFPRQLLQQTLAENMLAISSPIRQYLINTSFHGFRFIAEEYRHWTERVFWLVCVCLSWFASGLLIHASWNDFQTNAISFVVETSYLEWDTHFPSISVCETDNQKRIAEVTDKYKNKIEFSVFFMYSCF